MKNTISLLLLSFVMSLLLPTNLFADEGWKWNPFSSTKSKSVTKKSDSSWHMPKLQTPSFFKSSSAKKKKNTNNTAWNKMSRTSKSWWNKTTELLDPYPDPKPASSNASSPVSNASFWDRMMGKSEEKKYNDANDWLRDGKVPN